MAQKRVWSQKEKLEANTINALNLDSAGHKETFFDLNRHAKEQDKKDKVQQEAREKFLKYLEFHKQQQQQQQQQQQNESSSSTGNTAA